MLRFILSSLTSLAVLLGAIFVAPTAYASADAMPSGRYVDGFALKDSAVINDIFDSAMPSHLMFDRSSFSDCGYFAYVTKGITVTDFNGNQGSQTFDDWVLVSILFPENIASKGTIYVGARSFGVDSVGGVQPNKNYADGSQTRSLLCISSIQGVGDSQTVDLSFSIDCFNFDDNVKLPYNDSYRPTLYYNFANEYGGNALFDMGGYIPSYGSVDSLSNANLLAGLYDITFTPTVSSPANFPLIGKSLKVAPVAVRDDTGYNLVSLQVPQLGTYTDVVVFGEYHFVPRKSSSETFFNGLKFSFGSDPLNVNDDDYDGTITPSMFSCVVDGHPLKPKGMTVNSFSFFYNTKLQIYSNREFTIFDYSSTDSNIYPAVRFMGIGSINGMSAGSICYNCDFSGLVSPQSPKEIAEEGEEEIFDTVENLGYVPRSVSYPDPSEGFTFDDPSAPDFSVLGNIFSFMFNNRIIRAMLEMCLVVGLAGYVMYGKKGD